MGLQLIQEIVVWSFSCTTQNTPQEQTDNQQFANQQSANWFSPTAL
jgi:hypothetical protein